jgi:serine/threonine protein kinase
VLIDDLGNAKIAGNLGVNGLPSFSLLSSMWRMTDTGVLLLFSSTDFALARMKQENATTMTWCVTPAWTAPEVVRRERYTKRADVFSLGVIMWEVATRELPFASDENARMALHIVEGKRPAVPANVPPGYADLMQACWHGEAVQRPSAEQAAHMLEPLGQGGNHRSEVELV